MVASQHTNASLLQLDLVSDYAIALMAIHDRDDIVWYLAEQISKLWDVQHVAIFLKNSDHLEQVALCRQGRKTRQLPSEPVILSLNQGVVGKAVREQAPQIVNNTNLSREYLVTASKNLSEIAVPIIVSGEVIGVIDCEHPDADFFSQNHSKVLSIMAGLAGQKLYSSRTYQALQKSVEELEYSSRIQEILFSIAELVFKVNELSEFFKELHFLLGQLTFTKNFIIALKREGDTFFSIPFAVDEADFIPENIQLPINPNSPSLIAHLFLTQQSLLLNGKAFEQYVIEQKMSINGTPPVSWLGVPFGEGRITGAVLVQCYDDSYQFTNKDQQLLSFVAKHIFNAVERMESKSQLQYLALHDHLTGLANRNLFKQKLIHAVKKLRREDQCHFTLLYLDLDGFKEINDRKGHNAGDAILKAVANRLGETLRDSDTICRLGGDEFAVLLERLADKDAVQSLVDRLLENIKQPVLFNGDTISVSSSIGIVRHTERSVTANQLIAQADEAMYIAKSLGKNQSFDYHDRTTAHFSYTTSFKSDFIASIDNQDFKLVGQKIISLKDESIVGIEVLIRWQHPELGLLMPDKFIEPLENQRLIEKMDLFVVDRVVELIDKCQMPPNFRFNVNVSSQGFIAHSLHAKVAALAATKPHVLAHLCFEITEQSLISNVSRAQQQAEFFRSHGIRIALDDFGTGYSSLSYLHKFQFDELKIDRSFISTYQVGSPSSIILEAIINLAKSLNISVTAEGIETTNQLTTLQQLNCIKGQGYLIGKPENIEGILSQVNNSM